MKWKKYTIETTTVAEDYMSSMLMELGIEGIEIEDNVPLTKADQADMFIDFLPELPPDEGKSNISFYIEDDGVRILSVSDTLISLRGYNGYYTILANSGHRENSDFMHIFSSHKRLLEEEVSKGNYAIVLASAISQKNAERYVENLKSRGYKAEIQSTKKLIRVIIPGFSTKEEVQTQIKQMKESSDEFSKIWTLEL